MKHDYLLFPDRLSDGSLLSKQWSQCAGSDFDTGNATVYNGKKDSTWGWMMFMKRSKLTVCPVCVSVVYVISLKINCLLPTQCLLFLVLPSHPAKYLLLKCASEYLQYLHRQVVENNL